MPEGGRLTIRCAPATAGARKIADKVVMTPGRYVALVVEDTGSGIPPEVLEHVFEPFFTTKEVGQGSGLGLSMVYGFVKQTGGYIDISSEVGRGTSVTIYLPEHDGAAEQVAPSYAPADTPQGNGEKIFLIEDDVDVREVTMTMLSDLGYEVIDGGDGTGALQKLDGSGKVDLLLTDIVLPNGHSGPDLAKKARGEHANLKILYMTGYAENPNAHQG